VVDDGTHAAGGVAASEWLAANLGGGVFDTGGTGARIIVEHMMTHRVMTITTTR